MSAMRHRAFYYALWSQASLLGGLVACMLIRPEWAAVNYPISYFGNYRVTIIPYAAGFLLCAYWLVRTVLVLPRSFRVLRLLLVLVAACTLGVLCTPYMVSPAVGMLHLSFAAALLLLEVTLSVLLIITSHHIYALTGFLLQMCGAILAVLSQIGILHVELVGELLVIIGFGILFSYNLSLLDNKPHHFTSSEKGTVRT